MDKFKNKYRIPSARLQNWDYRWAGAYFVTICSKDRLHYFGEIVNKEMQLSRSGVIADVLWHQIPNHNQNIALGAFVVMPNHIHGIIIITQDDIDNSNTIAPIGSGRFQNIGKNSISSIIGSYKSAVTKNARRLGLELHWQTRFHDHIIRDEKSFLNISAYISRNPENWQEDRFFSEF